MKPSSQSNSSSPARPRAPGSRVGSALSALLMLLLCLAYSPPGWAQEDEGEGLELGFEQDAELSEAERERARERRRLELRKAQKAKADKERARRARQQEVDRAMARQLLLKDDQIHLFQVIEEMTDDLITDLVKLEVANISPMAMRRVGMTPNIDAQFARISGSYLRAAIASGTELSVKRCLACNALKSRKKGGEWVIKLGLTSHEELRREARRLGVVAFLDVDLAYFPGANIVAMQTEILRAQDGAVLWSKTYRSDATTAAILRTGDRPKTRGERVEELERKIEQKPVYGHILSVGGAFIPYDSPLGDLIGLAAGYRFIEKFGADRRWYYGLDTAVFANLTQGFTGVFVQAIMQYQLNDPNLNEPIYRTGPSGGIFVVFGNEGTSPVIEWTFDAIFQFRMGFGMSMFYYLPTTFVGLDLGGFGFKGRVSFNW